jgi:hypothetical protein
VTGAVALFKGFRKVKTLGAGVGGSLGVDTSAYSYERTKTSTFWGLVNRTRTKSTQRDDLSQGLGAEALNIRKSVTALVDTLGGAAGDISAITHSFKFDTRNMSEDQVQARLQSELSAYQNAVASTALGTTALVKEGESALDALSRMSVGLQTANRAFEVLGLRLYETSIAGGDAASAMVSFFGTLENFKQATDFYYQNFYSEQERIGYTTRKLTETMRSLGFSTIPATHQQFRMLVDGLRDIGDDGSVAKLLQVAPAFDSVAKSLVKSVESAAQKTRSILEQLERSLEARTAIIDQSVSRAQALSFIRSGDTSDTQRLGNALSVLSASSEQFFGSYVDYARDYGRTTAAISDLYDQTKAQLSAEEKALATMKNQLDVQMAQANMLGKIDHTLVTLSADLKAVQAERSRKLQIEDLQKRLAQEIGKIGDRPVALRIVEEVARGGSWLRDHASYVRLSNGQTFSSKQGGAGEELAHARAQAQPLIAASEAAAAAWSRAQNTVANPLRQQIIALGGVPQFFAGGDHAGGLRIVGEHGAEVEATGPARLYSNRQTREMFQNPELVHQIAQLRKEVEALRRDNFAGHSQIAKKTGCIASLARKQDIEGTPPVREGA